MSLKPKQPSLDHALLEQAGPDQAATLTLTWSGGEVQRFELRPCEAKLVRLLGSERANQTRLGFTKPGWIRLAALAPEHRERFGESVTARALSQRLYLLRKTLGEIKHRVVERDKRRGIRLGADLELLLREES